MEIIDTHSHIYQPDFDADIDSVINKSKEVGVAKILLPNIDTESIERVKRLSSEYAGYCLPMMGLHPTSVTQNWQADLKLIKSEFNATKFIAIGEIGLDLYWDKSLINQQKAAFKEQLCWSREFNLPVVIHSRDAIYECIDCINEVGLNGIRGVFHSFGGNTEELKAVLSLKNFYIGVNGVVTFKNSGLASVLTEITDLSNIIVETDAPYLSPVPYRGKRNESSYIIKVVEKLAEIYQIPPSEVAGITTSNAEQLFRI